MQKVTAASEMVINTLVLVVELFVDIDNQVQIVIGNNSFY